MKPRWLSVPPSPYRAARKKRPSNTGHNGQRNRLSNSTPAVREPMAQNGRSSSRFFSMAENSALPTSASAHVNAQSGHRPAHSTANKSGVPTAAVSTRGRSVAQRPSAPALTGSAIAALPRGELMERRFQVSPVEVGPQGVGHHKFRVGQLPQEEVGQPLLSARADEEIGVREASRVQRGGKALLVDVVRADAARLHRFRQRAARADDLGPTAVIEGQRQDQARSLGGLGDGAREGLLLQQREAINVADGPDADAFRL